MFAEATNPVPAQALGIISYGKLVRCTDRVQYFFISNGFVCTFSRKERCYFSYVKKRDLKGYNKSSIKIEDLKGTDNKMLKKIYVRLG